LLVDASLSTHAQIKAANGDPPCALGILKPSEMGRSHHTDNSFGFFRRIPEYPFALNKAFKGILL